MSSRSRSSSPEPIDPSPLHLKVFYSTRPGRFPSVDTLPHPTDPYISLSILPTTTLHTLTHLLTPHLPPPLLSPTRASTSSPHPSDIIGIRLSFCLVYPNPRSSPKYEAKTLGIVTIGNAEDYVSAQLLEECGFVTGDLVFVAVVGEGEMVPALPTFGNERVMYSAPRGERGDRRKGRGGGLEMEMGQWARGGGFAGRSRGGGGRGRERDRDGRGFGNWTRGEEVPEGHAVREEWAHERGNLSRGRGGGVEWTRGGRSGGGDRDRDRERW